VCCAVVKRFGQTKSCYHQVTISKAFIINRSPDTAETVCPTVPIFNDTVFMFTGFGGAWSGVMMLTTRCQTFTQGTLNGEVTSGLWFEMSVVHFHLNDAHKLNLPGELLYLLLLKQKKVF
jgi:hypothetical protein